MLDQKDHSRSILNGIFLRFLNMEKNIVTGAAEIYRKKL
jgi:hypothetical protein